MPKIEFTWAKCPKCDGEGSVPGERDYDNDDMPLQDWEPCRFCDGTGTACMEVKSVTKLRDTNTTLK